MRTKNIFRDIKGFCNYFVSEFGDVYSNKKNFLHKLTPQLTPNGYLKVRLYEKGKQSFLYVHRLVADAFLANPNNYPLVNHLDSDKTNNNVCNLEYCSARANVWHYTRTLKRSSKFIGVTWDKNRKKWQAQYQKGKKKIFLGRYNTEEEAHNAYINALKTENYA